MGVGVIIKYSILFTLSLSEFCLPLGGGGGFPSDEKLDPIVV